MKPNNPIQISAATNTGTVHSIALDAQFIMSGSIQAVFTDSAAAGTLTMEGSNDQAPAADTNGHPAPTNWVLVKNGSISATATIASGATTNISMQWLNYRWLRVTWVSSGGAGTFTVTGFYQGAA